MSSNRVTRRTVLRGLGITLALPWLETLAPRTASAQSAAAIKRYVMLYFPNGTADFWRPGAAGEGDSWKLSPILEPLAPVKRYLTVLGNVANYSPFGGHVEPSHSNLGASTWTCVKPSGNGNANNGVSVDQLIARQIGGKNALSSIQVGLSTLDSSADGLPGQHSRSMSWKSPTEPLYKTVNPQAVFDRLVSGIPAANGAPPDPLAERRRALKKSALDYVLQGANDLQRKLSTSDKLRLDQFLTSARSLEKRVAAPAMQVPVAACTPGSRPPSSYAVGNVPENYNRDAHADLMIELVTMAIRCDITRVVSFMLDDARSDFVYDFIKERTFTDTGSTPGTRSVAGYHGLQHAGDRNNGFATIGWWNAQKAASLAQKLMAIQDGTGGNALDNTVITFASGMKGGNHDGRNLPIALIGGGGKTGSGTVLKTDRYVAFGSEQRLADVHLTLLQKVFGCPESSFGASAGIIPDLLA
ncbi:MAG TPA: DUF1552 domain-containing protein [Polyangiaceae bacterium]|nr:DUF1552 domain-containing protein [Polyangiaceae bacterium]